MAAPAAPPRPTPAEAREAVNKAVQLQDMKRFEWFARIAPPLEFDEVSACAVHLDIVLYVFYTGLG